MRMWLFEGLTDFVVVLLFYVHGKHLRSCQDGLTEQRLFELSYWLQLLCNIGYGTCVFKFLYIPIESKHLQ